MGGGARYSLLPPVVKTLIIVNVAMFLAELSFAEQLIPALALWPPDLSVVLLSDYGQPPFHLTQLLHYAFLHGSPMHLFRLLPPLVHYSGEDQAHAAQPHLMRRDLY